MIIISKTNTKGNKSMDMKCVKGYKGIGFLKDNTDKSKKVLINVGDTIDCDDQGYLWKDNICFGHKEAEPKFYFSESK